MARPRKYYENNFLDLWHERSPETYDTAYEACDGIGSEMIIWLREVNPVLHDSISRGV